MSNSSTEKRPDIIICECNSTEHQIVVQYFDDGTYPECYLYIHLNKRPFIQRVIYGIKYIFGYQSKFGAFDEFIFDPKDADKVQQISEYLKSSMGEKVHRG